MERRNVSTQRRAHPRDGGGAHRFTQQPLHARPHPADGHPGQEAIAKRAVHHRPATPVARQHPALKAAAANPGHPQRADQPPLGPQVPDVVAIGPIAPLGRALPNPGPQVRGPLLSHQALQKPFQAGLDGQFHLPRLIQLLKCPTQILILKKQLRLNWVCSSERVPSSQEEYTLSFCPKTLLHIKRYITRPLVLNHPPMESGMTGISQMTTLGHSTVLV